MDNKQEQSNKAIIWLKNKSKLQIICFLCSFILLINSITVYAGTEKIVIPPTLYEYSVSFKMLEANFKGKEYTFHLYMPAIRGYDYTYLKDTWSHPTSVLESEINIMRNRLDLLYLDEDAEKGWDNNMRKLEHFKDFIDTLKLLNDGDGALTPKSGVDPQSVRWNVSAVDIKKNKDIKDVFDTIDKEIKKLGKLDFTKEEDSAIGYGFKKFVSDVYKKTLAKGAQPYIKLYDKAKEIFTTDDAFYIINDSIDPSFLESIIRGKLNPKLRVLQGLFEEDPTYPYNGSKTLLKQCQEELISEGSMYVYTDWFQGAMGSRSQILYLKANVAITMWGNVYMLEKMSELVGCKFNVFSYIDVERILEESGYDIKGQ